MRVLTVFKALAAVLLTSTFLLVIYSWSKNSPRSKIRERNQYLTATSNASVKNSSLSGGTLSQRSMTPQTEDNSVLDPADTSLYGKVSTLHLKLPMEGGEEGFGDRKVAGPGDSIHRPHFIVERKRVMKKKKQIPRILSFANKKQAQSLAGKKNDRALRKKTAQVLHLQLGNQSSGNVKKKSQSQHRRPPELLGKVKSQALLNSPGSSRKYSKVQATHSLSPEVVSGIQKFVFFVGYARSGHSIIGTLMDAHPHIVISNEFNLFDHFTELNKAPSSKWKENLYNMLYSRSIRDVKWSRANPSKGYKLKVGGLWQGRFDKYIEVIGDKSGDITTRAYSRDSEQFLRDYEKLKSEISVPLRIIHTVRNPFDIISTSVVINSVSDRRFRELKRTFNSNSSQLDGTNTQPVHKYGNTAVVDGNIPIFFKRIDTVVKLIEVFGRENVLDVHNCDLVADPKGTLSKIFEFLGVDATQHYLEASAAKVFKTPSRSRNMVRWNPTQIEVVETQMTDYKVLDRYSFVSD